MKTNDYIYFEWFNYFFSGMVVSSAIVIWAFFGAQYPEADSVTLFVMDRTAPNIKDVMAGVSPSANVWSQSYKAEIGLLDFCVMPHLYNYLPTLSDASTFISQNQAGGSGKSDIWTYISRNSPAWRRHAPNGSGVVLNHFNLPYDQPGDLYTHTPGNPNLPPQHFLPVCRCFNAVLLKTATISILNTPIPDQIQNTKNAMTSCVYTRQLIPRQKFAVGSATDNDSANTKIVSRSGFLLMMALAVLMNLLLRSWDLEIPPQFSERITNQILRKIAFMAIVGAMFTLSSAYIMPRGMTYTSLITFAGLAIMAIVEFAWMMQGESYLQDMKRQTYIHPFPFYITLVSLNMLALIENGVFTDENIFTYIWTSLAVSCLYTGVVICERRQMWNSKTYGDACQMGFLLYLFLAGLLLVVRLVPYFPHAYELNFLWVLPICFTAFCFAGVVFLERILDQEDGEMDVKMPIFTDSAHYIQLGHTVVLLLVLFYFASILVILAMNDHILIAANSMMNRLNFEVYQFENKAYVGF